MLLEEMLEKYINNASTILVENGELTFVIYEDAGAITGVSLNDYYKDEASMYFTNDEGDTKYMGELEISPELHEILMEAAK